MSIPHSLCIIDKYVLDNETVTIYLNIKFVIKMI